MRHLFLAGLFRLFLVIARKFFMYVSPFGRFGHNVLGISFLFNFSAEQEPFTVQASLGFKIEV